MPVDAYFAGGRVAVLSQKLWTRDKFIRLAESVDFEAALRMLYENGYGQGVSISNVNDYEKLLQSELSDSVVFLKEMTTDTKVTDCFLINFDYRNAKTSMKNKYMRSVPDNLYDTGLIDKNFLWQSVSTDEYGELPETMRTALEFIDKEFYEGRRYPSTIDNSLDNAMYLDILKRLKRCPLQSVKQYFTAEIDAANIIALFRYKRAEIEKVGETHFIGGSTFDRNFLVKTYEANLDGVLAAFKGTKYETLAEKARTAALEEGNFAECDKTATALKRAMLVANKNNITSEPVICYYLSKTAEIDNIRMILICVKNGLGAQQVKERLKELYV